MCSCCEEGADGGVHSLGFPVIPPFLSYDSPLAFHSGGAMVLVVRRTDASRVTDSNGVAFSGVVVCGPAGRVF